MLGEDVQEDINKRIEENININFSDVRFGIGIELETELYKQNGAIFEKKAFLRYLDSATIYQGGIKNPVYGSEVYEVMDNMLSDKLDNDDKVLSRRRVEYTNDLKKDIANSLRVTNVMPDYGKFGEYFEFITKFWQNNNVGKAIWNLKMAKMKLKKDMNVDFPDFGIDLIYDETSDKLKIAQSGSYHINVTFPDTGYAGHLRIMKLLQYLGPLFISNFGVPNIWSVGDNHKQNQTKFFVEGSERIILQKYAGLGNAELLAAEKTPSMLNERQNDEPNVNLYPLERNLILPKNHLIGIGNDFRRDRKKGEFFGFEWRIFDLIPLKGLEQILRCMILAADYSKNTENSVVDVHILIKTYVLPWEWYAIYESVLKEGWDAIIGKKTAEGYLDKMGLYNKFQIGKYGIIASELFKKIMEYFWNIFKNKEDSYTRIMALNEEGNPYPDFELKNWNALGWARHFSKKYHGFLSEPENSVHKKIATFIEKLFQDNGPRFGVSIDPIDQWCIDLLFEYGLGMFAKEDFIDLLWSFQEKFNYDIQFDMDENKLWINKKGSKRKTDDESLEQSEPLFFDKESLQPLGLQLSGQPTQQQNEGTVSKKLKPVSFFDNSNEADSDEEADGSEEYYPMEVEEESSEESFEQLTMPEGLWIIGGQTDCNYPSSRRIWVEDEFWNVKFTTPTYVELGLFSVPVAVSLGRFHSAILKADGDLLLYGYNLFGQLGLGYKSFCELIKPIPNMNAVKMVSIGGDHSAVVTNDGQLWTFGMNENGQLGLGDEHDVNIPTKVLGFSNVKMVSIGGDHSAIITYDGQLWTFGYNGYGQLGLGDDDDRSTPTKVPNFSDVKMVSLGGTHSAIITQNGQLFTFGHNVYGQLGLGSDTTSKTLDKDTPMEVTGFNNVKMVSLGADHSAIITKDGQLWTFGYNRDGELGLGDKTNRSTPTKVLGFGNVKMISSGEAHTAIITEDGQLWTFGSNFFGELGLGDDTHDKSIPTKVPGFTNVKYVAAGNGQTAVIV